ncbi:hypothetical protein XCR1_1430025 [Xenorhabdus cabanillasii JM26]|uniref:Uncharacterized protein n=1 Tax=Xenorhabdus cabanillasii JM26 TaxID=1427517 RepID=W1IQZ2_9GAMM|nr:hypothetical protein XCR1_1430025 [Xenorhabdus cabanillasii JM26]
MLVKPKYIYEMMTLISSVTPPDWRMTKVVISGSPLIYVLQK